MNKEIIMQNATKEVIGLLECTVHTCGGVFCYDLLFSPGGVNYELWDHQTWMEDISRKHHNFIIEKEKPQNIKFYFRIFF